MTVYNVIARRYRPATLDQLIGQDHVRKSLTNAIQQGRLSHAYLFTGTRGVGKTSTARILAKCLNCFTAQAPTISPCCVCDACREIADGVNTDVQEIDGAANNGVDAARDLISGTFQRPMFSRYRIYIIDEVHMLTTQAFNALLKTLEEPPDHVKFILATTEVTKIPITILSRCQRYEFTPVSQKVIGSHLRGVASNEGKEYDPVALDLIAEKAKGSIRDAQSILDQVINGCTGEITLDYVSNLLGVATDDKVQELVGQILERQVGACCQLLAQYKEDGVQPNEFLDQLATTWQQLLYEAAKGSPLGNMDVQKCMKCLEVIADCKGRMRASAYYQALLEVCVYKLCSV